MLKISPYLAKKYLLYIEWVIQTVLSDPSFNIIIAKTKDCVFIIEGM